MPASISCPRPGGKVALGDAATQAGGDADHQIDLVILGQLLPVLGHVAVVAGRLAQFGGVVDAVVIEEHPEDLVALVQGRLAELEGAVGGLMVVGTLVDQNGEFHLPLS